MTLIKIRGKEFAPETIQDMIDAGLLGSGEKHDASTTTPNAQALHGVYPGNSAQLGTFSGAGVRPGMFSANARVRSLSRFIPTFRNPVLNELIEIMTGVTAGSGNNSTNACADAPTAGDLKVMRQTYTFGIIHLGTRVYDITQLGTRYNRADIPREIYNMAMADNPFLPNVPGIDGISSTAEAFRAAMFALGVELERNVSPVMFVGTAGTENNTYRGVARQWAGLDNLIKTGYTDSVTGLAAAAADSDVVSFNALITGDDSLGRSFVEALTDTLYGREEKARALGLGGIEWAIVMRPDLFRAVTEIWACTYSTYRCAVPTADGYALNIDAGDVTRLRDDMMNGEYLLVNGNRVRVILDDSIARDTLGNNHYKSDIYIVALSWAGRPLLYMDYFPMDNASAEEFLTGAGIPDATTTTWNNGLYRVFKRQTKACIHYDVFARVRLILDAPFLSARLDDAAYRSFHRQTDATPGQSYYVNGGVSYR